LLNLLLLLPSSSFTTITTTTITTITTTTITTTTTIITITAIARFCSRSPLYAGNRTGLPVSNTGDCDDDGNDGDDKEDDGDAAAAADVDFNMRHSSAR
jgi:hypothetical protein